jgi:SLOG in TRPM, prokaryote/SMODS and SLOG-associating 2TM effector domain 1/Protein of unknown function (DUF4231)
MAAAWDDRFVTSTEDRGLGEPTRILFGNGNQALLVTDPGLAPRELLSRLGLQPGLGCARVIIVCGGANDLNGTSLTRARAVLGAAVSAASQVTGATVFDGGTSSGVMAITGAARASRPWTMPVLVGVAPAGLVSYPECKPDGERVPLEENHSHFILAQSNEWGGETNLLIGLSAAYAAEGRTAVVLAGGGRVSKSETLESVRRGWPVFVIKGTSGMADVLLELWEAYRIPHRRGAAWLWPRKFKYRRPPSLFSIPDPELREIVSEGDIRPVTGLEPGQLARQIAWELQDEPVLKDAWQQFATYDYLAARLRTAFTRFQEGILLLAVLSTLLALIQAQTRTTALHWVVVTIPILAAVLVAAAGRRAVGQRWVMLRAAAEAIKAEIYRYRALMSGADHKGSREEHARHQQDLAAQLDHIENRLMHTDASSGPLTPYDGPLPPGMYGADRDDDGLSPLDADRYLQIRIADQLTYYHGRIRSLSLRRNVLQLLAIAVGASGAILAAAGLYVWIGLTSATAAALLAYLNSLQVDNTIVTYNQSAAKLAGIERDWRALSASRLDSGAFEKLVSRSETVLTGELTGWVQQMSDTMNELKNKQASIASQIEPGRPAEPPEPRSTA